MTGSHKRITCKRAPRNIRGYKYVGQTGPRRGLIDIIGSAEGRAAYSRGSVYLSTEGVYIGEGLPPVPAKLTRKIRAGEFIEMDELLPQVWTIGLS